MTSERLTGEEYLQQDLESLSVSKRLVRSVSQKLKKKNHRSGGGEEDADRGFSLRCLTLYGRGGGCKVGVDTGDDLGDSCGRKRSNASEEGKGKSLELEANKSMNVFLPDDIVEMCLLRLPFISLVNARLVCKKWRNLTMTPRFWRMRQEGLFQNPWLFLFGVVKDGCCSAEIHALDVSFNQWHKINSEVLKGRFLFSVAGIHDDVYVVGGCSSLTNFGKVDKSSFKTHKSVLVFSPLMRTWRKAAPMKHARSSPILGTYEIGSDCLIIKNQQTRGDRRFYRPRVGGVSDVYEDPHRFSVRHQFRHSLDENEPLDSGEIYDSMSNKWTEIQRLPVDFGIACSGVVCNGMFYVYSETDKLAAYDVEKGYLVRIQTSPFPTRVHEYHPKLICCNSRLFMLSVSWCEGEGQIGRRNKAVRKLWELDLVYLTWKEVSIHPDAPMDWNAAFIADKNSIFGVEMFKIFGQVLDFLTVGEVSDTGINWSHISRNRLPHELDAASCLTKSMAVLHL
ncbi:hypothetical protein RND71_031691 [Anisodus tanguticus]|uniref:F-box domain-containing protein n=1 Tax=Anisodus tanguticus TaxID=243964 RepID=A0AAE1RD28_9SOLA|nr:hypothetical protein RND71_031691 [Anisodus tanguticus]